MLLIHAMAYLVAVAVIGGAFALLVVWLGDRERV